MTREEAHKVLDAAQNGADVREAEITVALKVTGDIETDSIQVVRPAGSWERAVVCASPAGFWDGLAA